MKRRDLSRRRRLIQRVDRLNGERATIAAGIDLVASGQANRVSLCGLRFGERLLADAVDCGRQAGLRVRLERGGESPMIVVARLEAQGPD